MIGCNGNDFPIIKVYNSNKKSFITHGKKIWRALYSLTYQILELILPGLSN